jgi:O-acetylserine/cysteine efflux transporter
MPWSTHGFKTMLVRDRLLLVGLTAVWGLNFSVIKVALADMPPLLLAAMRFLLVALPAVWLLPKPTVPASHIAAYGLTMFAMQFAFLFAGMSLGVGAGVASLLLQFQVFVTIALALGFGRERPSPSQMMGTVIAAGGLAGLVAGTPSGVSRWGLLLVLLAATAWGVGNTLSRRLLVGQAVLPSVAWGSLVSVLPLAAASMWLEGWPAWRTALVGSRTSTWLALAYVVYPTTLAGFSLWAYQLRRYPAAAVAPFTMLVPVFGLLFAALTVGEPLTSAKVTAAAVVLLGVALCQWGQTLTRVLTAKGWPRA